MASFTRYSTKEEDTSEEGELESEDDGDSGGESFLTDEEEFVPDEDFDDSQQDDEEPSTSSGGQDASPPAEEPSTLPAGKDASPPAEELNTAPAGQANIMTRDRYQVISWNIHMSDPEEDVENDRKKGTPDHDRLFRLKLLLDTIKNACLAYYHPRQNLAIDERMVATKAHTGMTQHMKAKPIRWGFKLFVLADSSNGYTVDFTVYTGKSQFVSGVGLAYDSVMSLMNKEYLGSGFHLYVDNFYTSSKLFKDLFSLNVGACGTYRGNRKDFPHTDSNALKKNAPRGSIRWIREGPLVFVKWMDTREVSICSTIHPAFSGNTVKRRVKTRGSEWTTKCIPCPTPIGEYNRHMGGVDMSNQLIQYYSVHHKSMRWYRTLFFHFLDIAATNSYLLHKELCREKKEEPMSHRDFLQELTAQLCGVTVKTPPGQTHSSHVPVAIAEILDELL
ncbi:hypothetical protein EPR50_G00047400 [Perca flavescens]|uniref:PiggyBac transposable element-derived protein domain-containing protein n=1 Tax=Perca flavescens TaxID=8167 RepID=A0A484DBM6_PERFV|nr:hypothetical protein EPR50_G00047400 [Perca flavescens]